MKDQDITRAYREAAKLFGPASVPTKLNARCLSFQEAKKIEGVDEEELLTGRKAAVVIIEEGVSLNRVKYQREVLRRSTSKFEGCKVFYDHRDAERSFRDLAGKLSNIYYDQNRMVAVLEVVEPDKWLQSIVKNHPELVGLSVYLWCTAHPGEGEDEGLDVIDDIVEVQSVDLVDAPAAGGKVLSVLENTRTPENPAQSAPEPPETPTEQPEALHSESQDEAADAAQENDAQEHEPEPVTDDVKENEKMEKQIQELEAQLRAEKTLSAELKIKNEALEKANADYVAENAKLTDTVSGMRRTAAMESFFKAKRADAEKDGGSYLVEVEEAVRMEAGLQNELDETFLTKCFEKWNAVSAKVAAPAASAGLPPVPVQESVQEHADEDTAYLENFVNSLIG